MQKKKRKGGVGERGRRRLCTFFSSSNPTISSLFFYSTPNFTSIFHPSFLSSSSSFSFISVIIRFILAFDQSSIYLKGGFLKYRYLLFLRGSTLFFPRFGELLLFFWVLFVSSYYIHLHTSYIHTPKG